MLTRWHSLERCDMRRYHRRVASRIETIVLSPGEVAPKHRDSAGVFVYDDDVGSEYTSQSLGDAGDLAIKVSHFYL